MTVGRKRRRTVAERPGAERPLRPEPTTEIQALKTMFAESSLGVAVADSNGEFLFINESARTILGGGLLDNSRVDGSRGHGLFLLDGRRPYPPGDLPLARALRGETVLDEPILVRSAERPSGAVVKMSANPWRDGDGAPRGALLVFSDVTAESRKTETIRRLSSAVEQTADAVLITDANGAIEYVNAAFEKITGYHQSEVLGRSPSLLRSGHHDRPFYERLWGTILGGAEFRATIVNRRKNGSLFWAEQTITPMRNSHEGIVGFVSVLKDMTERRLSQERESQILLAREVQRRFYDIAPPVAPGLEIAGEAFPAAHVGGDYFDFVAGPDGGITLAIGDVTGHGLGPALLMAETRACTRAILETETDPGAILGRINEILIHDLDANQLVTLLLARLDPRTRVLEYSSAGHVPGYVLDGSGGIEHSLGATGMPLGLSPGTRYPSVALPPLSPGNMLALLTDGITEATDSSGDEFGAERALEAIRRHRHRSASEIIRAVYDATLEFAGGEALRDDVTCVICKTDEPVFPRTV